MDKNTQTIIEAGITPVEFKQIFADSPDITIKNYLKKVKPEHHRFYHLSQLAELRNNPKLADYFLKKSGWDKLLSQIIDECY